MINKVAHKKNTPSYFRTKHDGNSYAATVHVDVDLKSTNLKSFPSVGVAV